MVFEVKKCLDIGREVLTAEADALSRTRDQLGVSFTHAVEKILSITGKVVWSGLGKSGHICRKLAATMSSTGTPAFYLHPGEAMHGDLGMLQKGDLLVAVAFSGETQELLEVARYARRRDISVVAITGMLGSSLAQLADVVLDGSVEKEADGLGLAPTSSSTVSLALGDALAVAVMRLRGFNERDFASYHPGGKLGRRLSHVGDHARIFEQGSYLRPEYNFHQALEAVTCQNFGISPVVNDKGELLGSVTDGDLRRFLLKFDSEALKKKVSDLMSVRPKKIAAHCLSVDAVNQMDNNKVTALFVVDEKGQLVGLVRMHDLLEAKII